MAPRAPQGESGRQAGTSGRTKKPQPRPEPARTGANSSEAEGMFYSVLFRELLAPPASGDLSLGPVLPGGRSALCLHFLSADL